MPTPPRSSRVPASTTRGGVPPRRGGPRPSGRPPRPPVRRKKPRWALRTVTALSVVVLASAGIGHAVLSGLDSDISRFDAFKDMKNRPRAGDGMNVLMVGTDGRDEITEEERRKYRLGGAPCHCTDTIMIVHISEDRERASVVSLPRDSYAVTPGHTDRTTGEHHEGHPLKLNAAYAEGGPQLTIRTVENMTRVKIDHYLEVDFTSFMKTVDVLGGVKICTVKPLKDSYTGLDLPAGTHTLRGGQALQYVRARHLDGAAVDLAGDVAAVVAARRRTPDRRCTTARSGHPAGRRDGRGRRARPGRRRRATADLTHHTCALGPRARAAASVSAAAVVTGPSLGPIIHAHQCAGPHCGGYKVRRKIRAVLLRTRHKNTPL
ncbi:Polyisoprenyl-teichoic acid--peptidoglycan teichoic acid transferase TagU [Streptomyces tendae]